MITNEIVRSVMAGGRVLTSGGVRRCAGNADIVTGGCVTVLNDMIIGWRRRAGAVMSPTLARYYHFADATLLKMYYVDIEFAAVVKTEDITPPVDGATLLLHAYNDDTEYLVWFVDPVNEGDSCRCIIQQGGETVEDFTSVFPATLGRADAYIDSEGKLQWVAATKNPIVLATYENGTLVSSCTDYASRAISGLNGSDYNAQAIRNAQRASVSASWDNDVNVDSGIYYLGPKDTRARKGSDYPGSVFTGSCETLAQMVRTSTATDYQISADLTSYLHISPWLMAVFGRVETEIGSDDFETTQYDSDVVDYVTADADTESRTGRISGIIQSLTTAHDLIVLPDDVTIESAAYIGSGGGAGGSFNQYSGQPQMRKISFSASPGPLNREVLYDTATGLNSVDDSSYPMHNDDVLAYRTEKPGSNGNYNERTWTYDVSEAHHIPNQFVDCVSQSVSVYQTIHNASFSLPAAIAAPFSNQQTITENLGAGYTRESELIPASDGDHSVKYRIKYNDDVLYEYEMSSVRGVSDMAELAIYSLNTGDSPEESVYGLMYGKVITRVGEEMIETDPPFNPTNIVTKRFT